MKKFLVTCGRRGTGDGRCAEPPPSYSEGRISTVRTLLIARYANETSRSGASALFPSTSTVLTFIYCDRHAKAPFGLSWSDLKELTRDPLCLDEKQFGRWLSGQERKKAWPCHAPERETRKPAGRPPIIDDATVG